MPPNVPNERCTSRRAFLEVTDKHEVSSLDLDESLATKDPHNIHAALHLHRFPALRNCDGRTFGLHAWCGYRRNRPSGADQQSDSDSSVADFLRPAHPADPWSGNRHASDVVQWRLP